MLALPADSESRPVPVGNLIRAVVGGLCAGQEYPLPVMIRFLGVVFRSAAAALQSRRELLLENLALRQQLSVLQATSHRRLQLTNLDRAFWTLLRHRWSEWKRALVIVQPETVVRWHRQGFKYYWQWKSRTHGGRPRFDPQIQALVQEVISLDLRTGISTSLDAKRDAALGALDDLNANNDVAAINSLNAFINAVSAQSGNAISVAEADALIAAANAILALL